ncbi:serine/threonine-protein kinase [Actinocorallia sp. A-T 12471]|uniref:serine/threonine-protein kinase n=1 Tax=Actinocorallia sp. A-T 12471 TaxID=3089813 RepID=UPI0029CCFE4D|nr:serine/threonine-protein kinase [Actinocorallia sp. A-T 12471]MDX6743778.1 serine/threonine-protein kinase [Actinocorallia sp. A-T 12471]
MPNETPSDRMLARRYRLHAQVGRGGMGTVWQAFDEVLGRDVAVKEVILPHGLTDEERDLQHRRTFREARTAARLAHPGVVTVYDVVEEDGRPWIVMELIKADSLDRVIKGQGTLDFRRAARIGGQMISALHAAHEAGILHRDVKPSNVLLAAGDRAVLTDFGIATSTGDATLTATGLVMGSPAYIAPERARGKVAGPASDLWSLGITLYAMVEGRSPYERPEPMASLIAIITDDVPASEKAGPLGQVIEGLLDKDPETRLTAHEAGRMLDEIARDGKLSGDYERPLALRSEPAEAAPTTAERLPDTGLGLLGEPTSAARSSGNRTTALIVAAIVLVTAMIVGGIALAQSFTSGGAKNTASLPTATASGTGTGTGTSQPNAGGTPSPSDKPQSETPSAQTPPPGYRLYQDPSGYSMFVPNDFGAPDRSNAENHFFNGEGGVRVQIGQTDAPGPSALADWQQQAPSASFTGYRLLEIRPTGAGGLPVPSADGKASADWEFTFRGNSGGEMRALNRGFVMGDMGYAILVMAPASTWDATMQKLQPLYASFKGK